MIELRYITTNGYVNGVFVDNIKQLQYRVLVQQSGYYGGMIKPEHLEVKTYYSKWKSVPDVGWDWDTKDTDTEIL